MYLSYEEYEKLGGTLSSAAFAKYAPQAESKIDYNTFRRLVNDTVISDKVKQCMAMLVDILYNYGTYYSTVTNMTAPTLTSQSNDGVSVTYGGYAGNTTPQDMADVKKQTDNNVMSTIREYLAGEKNQAGQYLLYRGVGINE